MGRFVRQLIAGREHELLGLCAPGEEDLSLRLASAGPAFYPLWEQVCVPALVREHQVETYIAPYNTGPLILPRATRLVLVVHDLIFLDSLPWSRSLYQNAGRLYRRLVVPRAIQRADLIVTVSQFTRQRIVERFRVDPSRIRIIPNALSQEWFLGPHVSSSQERYVLTVAGEAPSKNLRRGLEAFALCKSRLNDPALRLKIAGVKSAYHPAFRAHAEALGIAASVDFTPYLSASALRTLYQQAAVFFMPSVAEGFGIPVLEAMASATPVVSSCTTSLPEIGGDAARYFDPLSVNSMSDVLCHVLSDSALRACMAERGIQQSLQYQSITVQKLVDSFWTEVGLIPTPAHAEEHLSC